MLDRSGVHGSLLKPDWHTPLPILILPSNRAAEKKNKQVKIAIDGKWYDLTTWKNVHPGGKCL